MYKDENERHKGHESPVMYTIFFFFLLIKCRRIYTTCIVCSSCLRLSKMCLYFERDIQTSEFVTRYWTQHTNAYSESRQLSRSISDDG